jgi:hypothetical protein
MRADAYIFLGGDANWRNEVAFKLGAEENPLVIADSYFIHGGRRAFLEVDHLQHMNKNQDKIARYKQLRESGAFQKKIGYFPRLIWVTTTENRKAQLIDWCEELDSVVYLWSDIQ